MNLSAIDFQLKKNYSVKPVKNMQQAPAQQQNRSSLISFSGAQGMRSAVLTKSLSFKGKTIPDNLKVIPSEENGSQNGITNLLALERGTYDINNTALQINVDGEQGYKTARVVLGDKEILSVRSKKEQSPDVEVKFTKGKDGEVATIKGNGFKAVAIEGSEIKTEGFEFKMPSPKKKDVAFGASLHPVMAFKPQATEKALTKALPFINDLSEEYTTNQKLDENYTLVQAIGGFGTRLRSLVPPEGNKTAANTPAGIPLLAYSLLPVEQAGIEVPFSVEESNITVEEDSAVGTAGGLLEGIKKGKIPTEKTLLVIPGDGIHDINIKPDLEKFRQRQDAGIMLIGNAVPKSEIDKFGIIGTNTDGVITSFIEKPKEPDKAVAGIITDENGSYDESNPKYNANIAIYAFKPKATKALVALGDIVRAAHIESDLNKKELSQKGSKAKEYDFGKHALPVLQVLCNEDILGVSGYINKKEFRMALAQRDASHPLNKLVKKAGINQAIKQLNPVVDMLKDENGERLKMLAYAGDADWADVGSIPQFIQTSRDIAAEKAFKNLPEKVKQGFRDNVDLKTGIVYIPPTYSDAESPKELFDKFLGIDGKAKGNIVVMEVDKKE